MTLVFGFMKFLKKRDGQSLIMTALLMTAIFGFAALTIDVGSMVLTKSNLQNIADAAALAGAQELPDDPAQARIVAQDYVSINGKPGDSATITIGADNKSISVAVNRTDPSFFARVLGVSASIISADATVSIGVAASVPWIVPFVIPKPDAFDFDKVYVMRMYGAGDYLDYPAKGYPNGYSYPSDYRNHTVYKNYPLSDPYPYQFDYMNVYIKKNSNFYDYIHWLEFGYHETFSINQNMYYLGPSSGGKESVDAFARRVSRDPNTDYTKAKAGDGRVMLIPVVEKMLKRNTSTSGNVPIKIIGFVGFFIEKVHKNSYGESFWFEGRFLEDLNIGSGEITFDPAADFGLRVQKLTD
jgi:Flp pilus assembly protein TadG